MTVFNCISDQIMQHKRLLSKIFNSWFLTISLSYVNNLDHKVWEPLNDSIIRNILPRHNKRYYIDRGIKCQKSGIAIVPALLQTLHHDRPL